MSDMVVAGKIECVGKAAMATRHHASAVLKRMQRARRRACLQVYRCQSCGLWHVGSTVPTVRQRPRRGAQLREAADD